jgi:hypothetical protein
MILPGKRFEFISFLVLLGLLYIAIELSRRGIRVPKIREFAALQAIPEAIGRAAELNRPVHISTGIGGLSDEWAPMTIAAMAILRSVVEYCGKLGVPVKYFCIRAHMLPAMQDLVRGGYVRGGRPERYSEDMVEFIGDGQQRALMAAMMGYISREKPAVNILLGATFYETYISLGCGAVQGCLQIAGTPRLYYQGILVALADYPLIGQELYAAAAKVSGNPPDLGSIAGQDYNTVVCLILIVVTTILATVGSKLWSMLLSW